MAFVILEESVFFCSIYINEEDLYSALVIAYLYEAEALARLAQLFKQNYFPAAPPAAWTYSGELSKRGSLAVKRLVAAGSGLLVFR